MKEIDTETKLKALELYIQGKSNREIARLARNSNNLPVSGLLLSVRQGLGRRRISSVILTDHSR